MNLVYSSVVPEYLGITIPHLANVNEINNNILRISPAWNLSDVNLKYASLKQYRDYFDQADLHSGLIFKSVMVESNTVYQWRIKLDVCNSNSNESTLSDNISPLIFYCQSGINRINSSSADNKPIWSNYFTDLNLNISNNQTVTLELYIPSRSELQGFVVHNIDIYILFNPFYFIKQVNAQSSNIYVNLYAESYNFAAVQQLVCNNSVIYNKSTFANSNDNTFSGSNNHISLKQNNNISMNRNNDISLKQNDIFVNHNINQLFDEVLLLYDCNKFFEHLSTKELLSLNRIQVKSWLFSETANLSKLFKYAIDKNLQNILIILKPVQLHSMHVEMWNEIRKQIESKWSTLVFRNESQTHICAFGVNCNLFKSILSIIQENDQLSIEGIVNYFSNDSFVVKYAIFSSTDDVNNTCNDFVNITSKMKIEQTLFSAFEFPATKNILKRWQSSHWNNRLKCNTRSHYFHPLTTITQNAKFQQENLVTVVVIITTIELKEIKQQFDLTILNLLIQNYFCWSVLFCVPDNTLFEADLNNSIQCWNNYLRHWIPHSCLNCARIKLIKIDNELNLVSLQQILNNVNGKLFSLWNPGQFFNENRISKQVAQLYQDNFISMLYQSNNEQKDYLEYYNKFQPFAVFSRSDDFKLYEPLLNSTINSNKIFMYDSLTTRKSAVEKFLDQQEKQKKWDNIINFVKDFINQYVSHTLVNE